MRVHFVQHVSFETPGLIERYALERQYQCSETFMFDKPALPASESFDALVVMGGPMSAYDDDTVTWLRDEKRCIEDAIRTGKKVLGVCLGAQLIASVLSAKVYPGKEKEIGWFPVFLTEAGRDSRFSHFLPSEFTALHWHDDTFDLPKGAVHLASSELTPNQAFSFGTQVLALQFRLELGIEEGKSMTEHCATELEQEKSGRYVQSAAEILGHAELFDANEKLARPILDAFFSG